MGQFVRAIVFSGATEDLPSHFGTEAQPEFGAGQTKYYPSNSTRTIPKDCFSGNPPTHLDLHQQIIELSAHQMVKFAREIGLEVSLANYGMLEDFLRKISSKFGRAGGGGEGVSPQSPFPSKAGSTIGESVASRSFYSLPTITESVASNPLPVFQHQQPCSSHQADDALGF